MLQYPTNAPRPILIAGPTASGKSALALRLAALTDGWVINADALQVYDCWRVLSARPSPDEEAAVPHHLYGHLGKHQLYSAGGWLDDVRGVLVACSAQEKTPIIIGGTGLYFSTLTQGLAAIPPVPEKIRSQGNHLRETQGVAAFLEKLGQDDPETLAQLDQNNPARLQRAWEVLLTTGRGLSKWHAETPAPLIAPDQATNILLDADRDWLANRIDLRFDLMIDAGALNEVRAYCADGWTPNLPSAQAIGAAELAAHLAGTLPLTEAIDQAKAHTRQYAKRQRTWFRSKMKNWQAVDPQQTLSKKEINRILQHHA